MSRGGKRPRQVFINQNRLCQCGECKLCRNRAKIAAHYRANAERIIQRTRVNRQLRQARGPELTDEELDRRALELLRRDGVR